MADETNDETSKDPRLEEIQEDVDEIRARLPKNPGLGIPDPDVEPVMGEDEDTNPPV